MAKRSMPAGRYFGAFVLIVAALYGLIFFTGTDRTPQLGLDLRGGTTVTLTARTPDGQAPAQEDLELARQIIEQRVNGLGVAEAEVVTEGDSNIVISVPGDDGEQARELGATAQLRFRPVISGPEPAVAVGESTDSATPTESSAPSGSATPTDPSASATTTPAAPTTSAAPSASAEATPSDGAVEDPNLPDPNAPAVTQEEAAAEFATLTCESENVTGETSRPQDYVAACSEDGTLKYLLGPTIIEGTEIDDANAATEPTTGAWIVLLDFKSEGRATWAEYTAANVGSNVAFTLDGRVISAPVIQGAINGQTTIQGDFDEETATELANQLRYGALPLTFEQATAQSISTELGEEQLQASDRGASVRMPVNFVKNGYKGYLEDRRPNSAADPYLVAGRIIKTIQTVPTS
jgi:preprotein translocase subunit SecD